MGILKKTATFLVISIVLASAFSVSAQNRAKQNLNPTGTISANNLKKNLYILASKDMEGRETATRGQAKAASFIAAYYKQIGLAPGNKGLYFQDYPLIKDTVEQSSIKIGRQEFKYQKDFAFPLTLNNQEQLVASALVWAGYGITDSLFNNLATIHAKDKILLVMGGEPAVRKPSRWGNFSAGAKLRAQAAAQLGARAVFIIDTTFSASPNKFAGSVAIRPTGEGAVGAKASVNVYFISKSMAKAIMGNWFETLIKSADQVVPLRFEKTISVAVRQQIHHEKLQSSNVMAYLPGTDKKDELLIISAHYDHLGVRADQTYFGADDNASGTASVMELARLFSEAKAAGKGPRRSILFLNVSGEEQGLWGSDYYTLHPVYPLNNTVADLNTDMIGRVDTLHTPLDSNYIYIIGDNKLSSALRPVNEGNNQAITKLTLDYKYNDPADPEKIYYRSDHYNFAKNNIPIVFFFDGINKDYHQVSDTPDKISYGLMSKRLTLVFYDAWEIANREDRLPVDRHEK
ncbi:M28 family peptidase [Pedobacter nutrimenti]|uniref:Zn-dependent M28 family amino/carboxypeptidase n=1 Tax=Pedobacter nutrimenti TaxID=1241337 RepID=A0A318V010_9SPHI|nr:M28 family peptidase [Pedobacter nutrimenti]PYF77189.1 Zn-dependent M28 family amino/carboxypeptidase [Pedobacter nutrimenti]